MIFGWKDTRLLNFVKKNTESERDFSSTSEQACSIQYYACTMHPLCVALCAKGAESALYNSMHALCKIANFSLNLHSLHAALIYKSVLRCPMHATVQNR